MIVVQRVRVRWGATGRGAPSANARRGLAGPANLPGSLPAGDVVVHEVLADEADGYARREEVTDHPGAAGLALTADGAALVVHRLPGWATYPRRPARRTRLFTLGPGEIGRYRANFRFVACQCDAKWSYEDWTLHVSNGPVAPDGFVRAGPGRDVDARVHLYGGRG